MQSITIPLIDLAAEFRRHGTLILRHVSESVMVPDFGGTIVLLDLCWDAAYVDGHIAGILIQVPPFTAGPHPPVESQVRYWQASRQAGDPYTFHAARLTADDQWEIEGGLTGGPVRL